jgi:3-hydroxyisobutyrate dehydrogenase
MTTVAFLGLGKMGTGMALRLVSAGHRVQVYARTASKGDALVAAGAQACATPRDACAGAQAVFSMVSDDAASRAVWVGPDGALGAALEPRAFAIECSTLSRSWVLELAAAAAARGLRYIDAPVTGLPQAARAGELTLLVGAQREDLDAAGSLLGALAQRVIHFGAPGAGTAYKLIINLIGAVQIASLAEGLALAERAGLELATVVDAIAGSQAASPQVVRNARRMLAGDHDRDVVFTPALRLKDVDYALRLAGELGLGTPFGAAAADAFRELCATATGDSNESQVIDVARGHIAIARPVS